MVKNHSIVPNSIEALSLHDSDGCMTILIIDDDQEDYEIFCEAIQSINPAMHCPVAESGFEALKMLNENLRPDYIFLDAIMPVMSGKEFLTEFNKNEELRNIPVVLYSSYLDQREYAQYNALGVKHFLIKKSNFAELCNAIKHIVS